MKRALVLSLICVLGLAFTGFAASLTGSWDTDITILPGQTNFNDAITIVSYLTVNYIVGDWTFTSVTKLGTAGWLDQDFNASGVLGAFSLSTALDLNPDATFGDLDVTAGVTIAGVTFGWDLDLVGGDTFLDFDASGVAGDVTIAIDVDFGDDDGVCDFPWDDATIKLGFSFCCVDISATVFFDCENGFGYAKFAFGGLTVPNLPWLTIGGYVTFDLDAGKTFVVYPTFDFGVDVCFDLYWSDDYAVSGNGFSIEDIQLDGIELTCTIGGVEFNGITYWGPVIVDTDGDGVADDFPGILGGYGQQYFEAYKISTTDDACCGPFSFSFAIYFDENSTDQLFDIDLFEATVEIELASQFTFDMGLTVDATAGFTQWLIGFLVTW
jgi:hypothetical protein